MSDYRREYIHFIEDIAKAVEKIEKYSKDLSFEEFSANEMVVDAIIRNFEVIGEAGWDEPHSDSQAQISSDRL